MKKYRPVRDALMNALRNHEAKASDSRTTG
jgi:hypothetical protein